ncbi:MAG: DJ-1/PfpI family protein [Puniceicoccales bacterium]|jgi:4-methyl-5(b-hydroxyethyl)-thiazole monophosphate biosynthesis|nr:DJ-1/PfpI family protein [Puniceicoccales bacterium]
MLPRKNILVLLDEGFEEIECVVPVRIWRYAGQYVSLVSCTDSLSVCGSNGITLLAEACLKDAEVSSDVLFLPGGDSCKRMKKKPIVLQKIRAYAEKGKLIAAICGAPLLLQEAGLLAGRHYTAYRGKDFPGADYSKPVVLDGPILTGRDAGAAFAFALQLLQAIKLPLEDMRKGIITGLGLEEVWRQMGNEE